ncbi:creatininase family protein [Frigidibacter sp. ROC022]|uniref:creatininase family protein n=1 Tax=Frigidibacter sp. ROC022 TaxID=2971796 RepID=UPI00215AD1E5|nr:creatininase family protein [Frigidibacter sp. ROC022]MCR8724562.1 creatininase family protein [Frigidibacter sp. ROC022]
MKRYWSDYTSEAFSRLDREQIVAVLPVGATEQHGPHLPLAVDAAIVNGMVEAVIAKLPASSKTLFLPTQAIGKSNEHSRYPGTLTFSAQTLISMWCEIGACVAASGVRKLVLLNSHGGQISTMDIVARELRVRHNMMVFCVNWFGLGLPSGLYSDHEMQHGIHAGDMETSVMLHLHPELVDMDKAQDFGTLTETFARDFTHISLSGAKPGWQIQDMNPQGAAGNAAAATADKGHQTVEYAADRLVELLAEVEHAPLSWLDNPTAW